MTERHAHRRCAGPAVWFTLCSALWPLAAGADDTALTLRLEQGLPDTRPLLDEAVRKGILARDAGDWTAATQQFSEALALDSQRADIWQLRGMTAARARDYAAASADLARAQAIASNDVDIALDRARVRAWSGDPGAGLTILDEVLAHHPDNGEAWDLRARLSWYQGNAPATEQAARRAVALDPLRAEFRLLLAKSLVAQGQIAAAGDLARTLRTERPDDDEVTALLEAVRPQPVHPWRVDVNAVHSSFTHQRQQDWQDGSVQMAYALSSTRTVYGRLDQDHRFGLANTAVTAGWSQVLQPGVAGHVELGVAPNADFLPLARLAGGGEWRVREDADRIGATFLSLDGSLAEYRTGTSTALTPGVIQYFDRARGWAQLRLNNSIDANGHYLNGWGLRLDHLLGSDWAVHAGWSRAPESDVSSRGGVRTMVRDLSAGLSWQASTDWALRINYLREDRANASVRHEFLFGGTYRY